MQDEAISNAASLEREVRALTRAGKFAEAIAACKRLNSEFPKYLSGWLTASQLALQVNESEIALRAIDQALMLAPGQPDLLLQKVSCLSAMGAVDEAREIGRVLGAVDFPDAIRSSSAGTALNRIGLYEIAGKHLWRAAELEPGVASNHYNLARTLRLLGRLDEAEQSLDRALEIDPGDSQAHVLRSGLRKQTTDSNHISDLSDAILRATTDPDRVHLGFALAKEWEDLGEFENAFNALAGAAALRRNAIEYAPEGELETMRKIREVFDTDTVTRGGGYVNAAPIFVVGLPCSGISLVDGILGAHPVVTSAGERQDFANGLQNLYKETSGASPATPAALIEMAAKIDFEALGETYISATQDIDRESAHFVDSLSLNFLYCGLIHLALPKSKIILLQRDPLDTCFALYRTLFDGGYSYSYDLDEIANYFVEYHRLAKHWIECLGDRIHLVRYEELVSGERSIVEALLDYCGLTHDSACFSYRDNFKPTSSASALQTASVGLSRNYLEQLQPVRDALEAAGIEYAEPAGQ
jgi:tetratricopeptide (TPR) repeat protein